MRLGTIVENIETGKRGVVVSDRFGCCSGDETPVVYEGVTYFEGTHTKFLKAVGHYDAKPDMMSCGAGKGDDCCIFLTMGAEGPCCERFGTLRNTLIFKAMNAKRDPPEPYPACMNQAETTLATA